MWEIVSSGCWINVIKERVKITAIGSFIPDSASSVAERRRFTLTLPSVANIAAASVEETIAPNRNPSAQETCKMYLANMPTQMAVISTPNVAREENNMNVTRAQQIAQSPDMKNVTYNGKSVYIEHVDAQTETATIHFLDNPEKQQLVPVSQLEEH